MLTADISVSVLEHQDRGFIDLEGEMGLGWCNGVVNVGLVDEIELMHRNYNSPQTSFPVLMHPLTS